MSQIWIALAQWRSHENVKFDVYDKHYEENRCQMNEQWTPPPPRKKSNEKSYWNTEVKGEFHFTFLA